ncbi:hypothetical protein K7432_013858 [Basidiobolus ranarum]|uniref:Uncharacterized protein n=1 Tax=Basidiobolus ranarum TaxID=34480 RepID=A0ABR2WIJ0_9FUNG
MKANHLLSQGFLFICSLYGSLVVGDEYLLRNVDVLWAPGAQPISCPSALPSGGWLSNIGCESIRKESNGAYAPCCDLKDICYATCGASKYTCENQFRLCMRGFCPIANVELPVDCVTIYQNATVFAERKLGRAKDFSCETYINTQRNNGCVPWMATIPTVENTFGKRTN